MGSSKYKMQECKFSKEFLKDAMQMKIKLEWECKSAAILSMDETVTIPLLNYVRWIIARKELN